jgi:hypothetical protein
MADETPNPPATQALSPAPENIPKPIEQRVSEKIAELEAYEKRLDDALKLAQSKIEAQGRSIATPQDTKTPADKQKDEINAFLEGTGLSI